MQADGEDYKRQGYPEGLQWLRIGGLYRAIKQLEFDGTREAGTTRALHLCLELFLVHLLELFLLLGPGLVQHQQQFGSL